jgi:hypothetical protein
MRRPSSTRQLKPHAPAPRALALSLALVACGDFSEDEPQFSDLDRLRVLAVRSEPADLLPGETATLSALTFEPDQRELQYAWSWCPSRQELADGGACRIDEAQLRAAWDTLGTGVELPPYDLGSSAEAQLTHVFGAEVLEPLCAALSAEAQDAEQARLTCLLGLELSVSLTVRSPQAAVTAVKQLVLLPEDAVATERNQNPTPGGALLLRDVLLDSALAAGDALLPDHEYELSLTLDEATAETFQPRPEPRGELGAPRRETLVLSWFTSAGSFPSGDGFGDGDGPAGLGGGSERTTFVDGENDFGALLDNQWLLPRTPGTGEAKLVLVLRDERGGVGWAEHTFTLGASE